MIEKKILFVIPNLDSGGAEKIFSILVNSLAAEIRNLQVLTLRTDQKDFYQLEDTIERHHLQVLNKSRGVKQRLMFPFRFNTIRKKIKQIKPDLVISFMDYANIYVLLSLFATAFPVIVSERNYPPLKKRAVIPNFIDTVSVSWCLVIFGEGKERPFLEQGIRDLDLTGRVFLPGLSRYPRAEMNHTQVFLHTSRYEGFGNVLLEAMACGLPIVSIDCPPGPLDIVENGKTGLFVKIGDVESIAQGLKQLMLDIWSCIISGHG